MKRFLTYRNIWLVFFVGIGISLSIAWGDTWLGFVAFLSGVLCVYCAAIGNRHTFSIGVINCATYAFVAYKGGLFGEVMLNAGFYFPLQFLGWYMWSKKLKEDKTVEMKGLRFPQTLLVLLMSVILTCGYGFGLSMIEGQAIPYIDSFTTVFSVIASIFMLLRYREYWILYVLVNVVSVVMWSHRFYSGIDDALTMVVMWSAYLVNSLYGAVIWYRGTMGGCECQKKN